MRCELWAETELQHRVRGFERVHRARSAVVRSKVWKPEVGQTIEGCRITGIGSAPERALIRRQTSSKIRRRTVCAPTIMAN